MNNNRLENFKKRPTEFVDANNARLVRAVRNEERIRNHRAEQFSRQRNVGGDAELEASRSRRNVPTTRLDRWRAERAIKRKIDQRMKKPVFKVGIVHHKFYSPPVSTKTKTIPQPCHPRGQLAKSRHNPTPPKRITRATQKRLEAKKRADAVTPAATSKASSSKIPSTAKRRLSVKKAPEPSFAPHNYSFKAPSGVNEIPMFGRVKLPEAWDEEDVEQPSTSRTEQSPSGRRWSSSVEMSFKLAMDKPWPTRDSTKPSTPQKMRGRLSRQAALGRFSEESSVPESTTNSSTDESIRLRLSEESQQENGEESSMPNVEKAEADPVEAEGASMEAPPRSGTPVPASFSPYIVTSRGKNSARKEQQSRMGMRRSSANEIPTKETVMQNLNISVEEEEQTAQYFKLLVERETDRLNELCAEWETTKNESSMSEYAKYEINTAIGQTKLLLGKKFGQFRSLIKDCETGKGEMLIRSSDLGGFWEMTKREIRDCEKRFLKLNVLRSNDWVETETVVAKVPKKKTSAVPAKAKINVKSSARSFILAARKKKMSQAQDRDGDADAGRTSVEDAPSGSGTATRPTGRTPKKTPTPLLKRVQLSQVSRSIRSPLTVMKINKMCKTPEVTLDDTISYVNSDQTPGKGILKKSEGTSDSEPSEPKSSRKVDFNDEVFAEEYPAAEVDEALQNSIDLGRALARIESYESDEPVEWNPDFSNVALRKIRLDFEDTIFDEIDTAESADDAAVPSESEEPIINVISPTPAKTPAIDTAELADEASVPEAPAVPEINIVASTPAKTPAAKTPSRRTRNTSRRSSTIDEASVEEEQVGVGMMTLRNRTITVQTPTKSTRRSRRASRVDEINASMTNTSFKENCDPQQENSTHTRRSTRKSVRFNPDDDCKACGETPKPKQPPTPHSRERKRVSLFGRTTHESSVAPLPGGDLMTFDTPAKH